MQINIHQFANLVELIDETCTRFGDRPAFSNHGSVLSFREVQELSLKLAAYFQSELKLKPGDRIAIQMPNLLQYPVTLFAALRAGLIVVNTNPLYTPHEMERCFADSEAKAIVILENFADKLETILPKTAIQHVILTEVGDLFHSPKRQLVNFVVRKIKKMVPAHQLSAPIRFREALHKTNASRFTPPQLSHEKIAFFQYTGGTTGISKAAMLSHGNMIANLLQMVEIMKVKIQKGQETVIAALPLYHVFCLTVNCFGLFQFGAHNVLITNPRDIPEFIKTLAKTRPTVMTAVSTLLGALMNHPRFSKLNLRSLKVTIAGGMALKRSVAESWKSTTGTPVIEGYGLTEASPVVTCNPLDGNDRLGTIGLPLPDTQIQLGEDGELCVKGPQVMQGYWKQPEETQKVIDREGWLHTGDIATRDPDGFYRIVDRKKDMILVSGFNVYPNEIEEVVMQHPKVLEAAAIGFPYEHSGEAVALFVVRRDPTLTADELNEHCRKSLVSYKCPKRFEFRTELPKTNVGKILRRELKAQL